MKLRLRNPAALGAVSGPGMSSASKNFHQLEERQFCEICFQLETDSHGVVGYADMDVNTGEGVLQHLFERGEKAEIRLESGTRELYLGDFGIWLDSENDRAIVTARW